MSLEDTLSGWTGPSSDTEQDKQDRTERMVREAVEEHAAFDDCTLTVYAKGSYANGTNVRTDSDVDVGVQCHDVVYWEESEQGVHPVSSPYAGVWTPQKLRTELGTALRAKFPNQVDDSGSTAFGVRSSSARVDADVVPGFDYKYYFATGTPPLDGTRIFPKTGLGFENYPVQQLANGHLKNGQTRTHTLYKKTVRVLKRLENDMVAKGVHTEVQSFFIECLTYNCPDSVFTGTTNWTDRVKATLLHIWTELEGDEPTAEADRWFEVNDVKFLFHPLQPWTRADARAFAAAAWNHLGFQ